MIEPPDPPVVRPHRAEPSMRAPYTDTHAVCHWCDRVIELAPGRGSRLGRKATPYWRHHSQPTSTMIDEKVRRFSETLLKVRQTVRR